MKKFILTLFALSCIQVVIAQQKITGTVTSAEDGLPIPGVSIVVKGEPTIGTATNIDGKYELTLPSDAEVLVFSSVGMKVREEVINGRTTIDVVLEQEALQMDEVMVVAYGTVKKSSYTGSAAVVDNEELEKVNATSVNDALMGSTPGLQISSTSGQPGAQSSVRIRGTGSLTAGSTPLYVVDGIPIKTGNYSDVAGDDYSTSADVLSSLNPSDIESVTVLKDASAASLYGSAAANGVIIITTKKGKEGEAKISFNAKYGVATLPQMDYDLMESDEIYSIYFDRYYDEAVADGVANPVETANANTISALTHNPYNVENPLDASGNVVSGADLVVNTDWIDEVFRSAKTQEYNLQASGGKEGTTYYISGGYADHEGITLGQNFKRYSAKFNLSSQLRDYLRVGMENTFSSTEQNTPPGGGGGASPMRMAMLFNNAVPVYELDQNGDPVLTNGQKSFNWLNPVSVDFNPLGLNELDEYQTTTNRLISSFWGELKFLENFTFKSIFNVDYVGMKEFRFYNQYHGNGQPVSGRGTKYNKSDLGWTSSNTLTFNKDLGDHGIDVLLGFEAYDNRYEYVVAEATNYPDLGGATQKELDNASKPSDAGSFYIENAKLSYFSQFKYDYQDRYYLKFSLRRDGSSRFGSDKQFGTFYAVGGSWRISEEGFMQNLTWLNDMKLRASYGTSGNDDIASFSYLGLYQPQSYNDMSGYVHSQLPNSNIHWEENINFNVGFDVRLFNRMTLTYEYYNRNSSDLLYAMPLPGHTGFTEITSNLADMKNYGHEVSVNATVMARSNFVWNLLGNISVNTNELTSITQGEQIEGTKLWEEGNSIYEFYLEEWAGVNDNGQPMWYTLDENDQKVTTTNYSEATRFKQGLSTPDAFGSIGSNFTYGDFDFSFSFYYSLGGQIYDNVERQLLNDGSAKGYQMLSEVSDSWTSDNPNASLPRFLPDNGDNSYERSTLFLHDATYIKLRSVRLSYNIPENFLNRLSLSSARLYVTGTNLWTWKKDEDLQSWDPEMGLNGIDFFRTPNPRTITFGLNVTL